MGSKRKTSPVEPKLKAAATIGTNGTATDVQNTPETTGDRQLGTSVTRSPTLDKSPVAPSRSSWYGSWRSKASPVAQIAKESISVAQGTTSESSEAAARARPSVSKSVRGSSRKSIPLAAEATRVHATSGSSRAQASIQEKTSDDASTEEPKSEVLSEVEEVPEPVEPAVQDNAAEKTSPNLPAQNNGWFAWWSRPDGYGSDGEKSNKRRKHGIDEPIAPSTTRQEIPATAAPDARPSDTITTATETTQQLESHPENEVNAPPARSWFFRWSNAQNQAPESQPNSSVEAQLPQKSTDREDENARGPSANDIPVVGSEAAIPPTAEASNNETSPEAPGKSDVETRTKSSSWVFWSSERPKDSSTTQEGTQKHVGKIAVADTPSQSHPEAAQFNEAQRAQKSAAKATKPPASLRNLSRNSAAPEGNTALTQIDASTAAPAVFTQSNKSLEDFDVMKPAAKGKAVQAQPNLILPSFREVFPVAPNPGYMERLTTYLAQSLHIPGAQPTERPSHVYISSSPPVIKKAIALGVHGFFPTPLVQSVIGQPTGTSIRFANYAATAIKQWCRDHQPDVKDVEIERVALEGEGLIADRVATLWKLLLNWLHQLRQADFIFVACHSQGVPVAVMLVAKLIQLNCLGPRVRIGICAMAGINLGPFPEYRSRIFGANALELFEFCNSKSKLSRYYAETLEICLRNGVRLTLVGSIDDQLVSLESSLHMPLSHPHVNRAVFIDGRVHAPNFLTSLVAFALRLRNIGISDHGLIRELSAPLAGSLVGGEGHSRVYDDGAVYILAVEFALETTEAESGPSTAKQLQSGAKRRRASLSDSTTIPPAVASLRRGSLSASSVQSSGFAPVFTPYDATANKGGTNPFYLPWAVRGMLEEDVVRKDMKDQVSRLVKEFDEWKPKSKALKDVRWRLEAFNNIT